MRRWWLGSVMALVALAVAPAVAAASTAGPATHVSVSPRSPGPRTSVHLRFRMPQGTGTIGALLRTDAILLRGPRRRGCIGSGEVAVRGGGAGSEMHLTLDPARLGGRWCVGAYSGLLVTRERLVCPPGRGRACPDLAAEPVSHTLASFAFRVAAA